jgi:hypothetical protein
MHPLLVQLQPLLGGEDIEGITSLLEHWQPRDEFWRHCIEGRIHAPSSTEAQRQRLRTVLGSQAEVTPPSAVALNVEPSDVARPRASSVAGDATPFATALELPGLEDEGVLANSRIAELPAESAGPALRILTLIRRENLRRQAWRREQFEEELKQGGLPRGSRFSEFLASLWDSFVRVGPAASAAEIEVLQALSPVRLGDSLQALYRSFGGISGEFGDSEIGLRLFSPHALLEAQRNTLRWQRLGGLSLLDMARWAWGNDRPELAPGALPPAVERAAQQTLCVGWLSEGSCEQHAYVLQDAEGRFHLHLWHQDNDFLAPSTARPLATDLWGLLSTVLPLLEHSQDTGLDELLDALGNGSG